MSHESLVVKVRKKSLRCHWQGRIDRVQQAVYCSTDEASSFPQGLRNRRQAGCFDRMADYNLTNLASRSACSIVVLLARIFRKPAYARLLKNPVKRIYVRDLIEQIEGGLPPVQV